MNPPFFVCRRCGNHLGFVKIILKENDNFVFTLRKRLFCNAKPTLLPCKTAAFAMQNNRFCNVLIIRWLGNRYSCEKYLHRCSFLFAYIIRCVREMGQRLKGSFILQKGNVFYSNRTYFSVCRAFHWFRAAILRLNQEICII